MTSVDNTNLFHGMCRPSPTGYRPASQPASQPVGLCRTCCIGTGKLHVLLSVAVMEKKVKMRSGGILIVVAIVQVLGSLFAFDANPTWKSCLPDSRLRHRGTGKWKARLLYLARFIAVLFACGVSTSVIPNCYQVCRTVLQSITKFSAHCHKSPREARNAEQLFRAVQAPFLPSGHAATSSILQFAEPWRHVQRNGYLPGIAALRSRMSVLIVATESALLASK